MPSTRECLLLKKMGLIAKDLCSLESLIQYHRADLWAIGHGMRRASGGGDIGPEARTAISNLRINLADDVLALVMAFERAWLFNFGDKDPVKYFADGTRDWATYPVLTQSGHPDSWVVDDRSNDGSASD